MKKDNPHIQAIIPYPRQPLKKDSVLTQTMIRRPKEGRIRYTPEYDDFILSSFIVNMLLLFVMFLYTKNLPEKIAFFPRYFRFTKQKEEHIHIHTFGFLQHLLSFIAMNALGYYLTKSISLHSGWQSFFYTTICLFLFIFSRSSLVLLSGYFIGDKKLAIEHYGSMRFFNKQLGLLSLPLLLIVLFSKEKSYIPILYTVISVFILKFILQLIFVSKLLRARKFSLFHSFLYLCTLEVLPVVYALLIIGLLIDNN